MSTTFNAPLIAPCGMNCALCYAFQRVKNSCPGCRIDESEKPITRLRCKIKNCDFFKEDENKFCVGCNEFPCKNLAHLDKRYRAKYDMSMIKNLSSIQSNGIKAFLREEKKKWKCIKCGGTFCVHKKKCLNCNK